MCANFTGLPLPAFLTLQADTSQIFTFSRNLKLGFFHVEIIDSQLKIFSRLASRLGRGWPFTVRTETATNWRFLKINSYCRKAFLELSGMPKKLKFDTSFGRISHIPRSVGRWGGLFSVKKGQGSIIKNWRQLIREPILELSDYGPIPWLTDGHP